MSTQKPPVRQIDVARKAGVSRACVSLALNPDTSGAKSRIPEETATRVRKVAARMGYRPNLAAQQLAGLRSRVIGLLLDGHYDAMPTSRMAKILFTIQKRAYEKGYRLLLANTYDDQQVKEYLEDFKSRNVEGVLCMHLSEKPTCKSLVTELAGMGRVVYYSKPAGVKNPSYVQVDYADGIEQAVARLVDRGCDRIALALYSATPFPMKERIRGYRNGMKKAGRTVEASLLWTGKGVGLPTEPLIQDVIGHLVDTGGADAIIASNDAWASAIIKALRRGGKSIPDDVAVIGFDNEEPRACSLDPELTSIDHNDEEIGSNLVDLLLAGAEDGDAGKARVTSVKPFLVVRESA